MKEDTFREPTADEKAARRILSMAIGLMNARRPRSTTEIRHDFYPEMADAAFKKAFKRDRERLETCGIHLREAGRVDRVATWCVDEEASFATEGALSPDDALTLDFLLAPLASDPTFPYARDLRVALAKIDRGFDGSSLAQVSPEARMRNNYLTRIEESLLERRMIEIEYKRADGSRTKRALAPYGLFTLNGKNYMVAARSGASDGEPPHTYNLDRVQSLKELHGSSFELPVDFDVRDFIRLPFQIGEIVCDGTFLDPTSSSTQTHTVADIGDACAWAISEGLIPLSPPELRSLWKSRLKSVVQGDDQR